MIIVVLFNPFYDYEIDPFFFLVMKRSGKDTNWRKHLHLPEYSAHSWTLQECHHAGTETISNEDRIWELDIERGVEVAYGNFGKL